jgi:hypothetical protein
MKNFGGLISEKDIELWDANATQAFSEIFTSITFNAKASFNYKYLIIPQDFIDLIDKGVKEAIFLDWPELPKRHRYRYSIILGLTATFFDKIGVKSPLPLELIELARGLDDLDAGVVRDWLKKSQGINGRPKEAEDVWVYRSTISIAIDYISKFVPSRKEACREILEHYRKVEFMFFPSKTDPVSLLEKWHDRFVCGDAPNDRAQSSFNNRAQLVDAYCSKFSDAPVGVREKLVAVAILDEALHEAFMAADQDKVDLMLRALRGPRKNPQF